MRSTGPTSTQLTAIKDADAVGEPANYRQVVRNEEIGETLLPLELTQQVDHIGLYGDVECGEYSVTQHQAWLSRQRTGDGDALALSAAELSGKAAHV